MNVGGSASTITSWSDRRALEDGGRRVLPFAFILSLLDLRDGIEQTLKPDPNASVNRGIIWKKTFIIHFAITYFQHLCLASGANF